METVPADRLRGGTVALRLALAAFVVVWILGPAALRAALPIWLPFVIALALEVHFFLDAGRARDTTRRRSSRLPQIVDRERYGYAGETDELLLVRDGEDELWIPYSGESDEELDELIADARDQAAREGELQTQRAVPTTLRRPVTQLLVGIGVIAALAGLVWVAGNRGGWAGLDRETRAAAGARFSAEASRIAGHPVTIRCDEEGTYVGAVQHADGVAAIGGTLAYLTPERCYDLYRLAFEGEVTFSRTARALAVLAHEAWHLNGVRDEGRTECYALQSGVDLGQRLGLTEDTARSMMRQQLAENRLHTRGSAEYLVTADCRDGGSLDLNPGRSAFP
jgi:hypothetical protein